LPERGEDELLVLDIEKKRVLYVDRRLVDSSMRWSEIFPYTDPIEQSEGTCVAYAMYNLVHQLDALELIRRPTTVEENLRMIGYFIHEYYLNPRRQGSIAGILNSVGRDYGFKCKKKAFETRERLLAAIDRRL